MFQPSELVRRVKNYLGAQSIRSLREIDVEAIGDVVVLRGRVQSFHQRQLAMALCKRVAGVREVCDRLEVSLPVHKKPHPLQNAVYGVEARLDET